MVFLKMLSLIFFLLISSPSVEPEKETSFVRIFGQCDKKSLKCPLNSFCAKRRCDGLICLCDIGFQPSEDFTKCFKVVELYRSCADESTRCRGPLSYCDPLSVTCRCIDGYIPATDNIRCKKMPSYELSYAMLGESCQEEGSRVVCQDSNQQVCDPETSLCTCREGLKPASNIDLNAEPFLMDECRPQDFQLDVELEECKKPVIIGIALIGQTCLTDNNCPDNSRCKQIGCQQKICRCNYGSAPTLNMETCKTGVPLGHICDDSVVCIGALTACIQGRCQCTRGSVEAVNKQCKSAPPIPGRIEFSALGEECTVNNNGTVIKMCENSMCSKGKCKCPPRTREMSAAEKLDNPYKFPPCIGEEELTRELTPEEFQLQCVTFPKEKANLEDLKHSGFKPGVIAKWIEGTDESNFAVEEFDGSILNSESRVSGSNQNQTLLDILIGNGSNETFPADDVAQQVFNTSFEAEIFNGSIAIDVNFTGENFDIFNDTDVLNETLNLFSTDDFGLSGFNESLADEFSANNLSFFRNGNGGNETFPADDIAQQVFNTSFEAEIFNGSIAIDVNFTGENLDDFNDTDVLNETLNLFSTDDFGLSGFNESLADEFSANNSSFFSDSEIGILEDNYGEGTFNSSGNEIGSDFSLDVNASNNSVVNDNNSTYTPLNSSSDQANDSNITSSLDFSNSSELSSGMYFAISNDSDVNFSVDLDSSNVYNDFEFPDNSGFDESLDSEFSQISNFNNTFESDSSNSNNVNDSLDSEFSNNNDFNNGFDFNDLNNNSNDSFDFNDLNNNLNDSFDFNNLNNNNSNDSFDFNNLNNNNSNDSFDPNDLNDNNLNDSFDFNNLNDNNSNDSFDFNDLNNNNLNDSFDFNDLNNNNLNDSFDPNDLNDNNLNDSFDFNDLNNNNSNDSFDFNDLNNNNSNDSFDFNDLNNNNSTNGFDFNDLNNNNSNDSFDFNDLNNNNSTNGFDFNDLNIPDCRNEPNNSLCVNMSDSDSENESFNTSKTDEIIEERTTNESSYSLDFVTPSMNDSFEPFSDQSNWDSIEDGLGFNNSENIEFENNNFNDNSSSSDAESNNFGFADKKNYTTELFEDVIPNLVNVSDAEELLGETLKNESLASMFSESNDIFSITSVNPTNDFFPNNLTENWAEVSEGDFFSGWENNPTPGTDFFEDTSASSASQDKEFSETGYIELSTLPTYDTSFNNEWYVSDPSNSLETLNAQGISDTANTGDPTINTLDIIDTFGTNNVFRASSTQDMTLNKLGITDTFGKDNDFAAMGTGGTTHTYGATHTPVTSGNPDRSRTFGITDKENVTGAPEMTSTPANRYASPNFATLEVKGGMEETLKEKGRDLGLALSSDGSHFIGSSGENIEPVPYDDDAEKDVDKIKELLSEEKFSTRNLLEKCDINDVCPPLSQCLEVGCGSPICFCLRPYGPSKDRKKCLPDVPPPVHCNEIDSFKELKGNKLLIDSVPLALAAILVGLGLFLLFIVVCIYLRLKF